MKFLVIILFSSFSYFYSCKTSDGVKEIEHTISQESVVGLARFLKPVDSNILLHLPGLTLNYLKTKEYVL